MKISPIFIDMFIILLLLFLETSLPFKIINPCPAEPGYTLHLQTV